MKYEKPAALDLSGSLFSVGRPSPACIPGTAASSDESCGFGTGATHGCQTGSSGSFSLLCGMGDTVVSGGDCFNGTDTAGSYCGYGDGGNYQSCHVGDAH